MKLNLFLLLIVTGLVQVAVSQSFKLIMTNMNWSEAQNYCREMYIYLPKATSDGDFLRLKTEEASKGFTDDAWVGMYNDIDSWRWSLNELPLKDVTYSNWSVGQPDNYDGHEACVLLSEYDAWWDVSCTQNKPFICYDANFVDSAKFIGINTPLNWSQAQTYCRTHHTDLASSLNSSDNNMLLEIKNIQGDSWIGLYRDTWKWIDGTSATGIPWNPGEPNNSGGSENCAVVKNGLFNDLSCDIFNYFFCKEPISKRSQTVRLQVKFNGSVFDPVVQSSILDQMRQKLSDKGMLVNTTVTWKVQKDGNIFQKIKDDL